MACTHPTLPSDAPSSPRKLLEEIEDKAKRAVTIHTTPTAENIAKCDPQSPSHLFKLPLELRDAIYELASTPRPDPRHQYEETALYYRPGHTARNKTDTALLLTCRRVWLEANHVPMQLTEHPFWLPHGPNDTHPDEYWGINVRQERFRYHDLLNYLTRPNLQNLTHIHCFMQMLYMEQLREGRDFDDFFPPAALRRGFRPKVFHVTIRHVDWWDWVHNAPLRLDAKWVRRFLNAPALRHAEEFWLELETPEKKRDELEPIVEDLRALEGEPQLLGSGPEASRFTLAGEPGEETWSRTPKVNKHVWWAIDQDAPLDLHIVRLKWRCEHFSFPPDDPTLAALLSAQRDRARRKAEMDEMVRVTNEVNHRKGVWWVSGYKGLGLMMWYAHVRVARRAEDAMRQRFERVMGDIVVGDLEREWEGNGSLLRFEEEGN